jgi:hypothetical protein
VRPNGTGDEHNKYKGQANLSGGYAQPIRFRLSREDVSQVRVEADCEGHEGTKGAGNMQIEYLLNNAHRPFNRGVIKSQVRGNGKQDKKNACFESAF